MLRNLSLRFLVLFPFCLAVTSAWAQNPPAAGKTEPAKAGSTRQATAKVDAVRSDDKGIQKAAEALSAAFNSGKAAEVAALFLPDAELIDDAGNLHKGRKEIESVLAKFFERFPGSQLRQEITATRPLSASLVVQEGVQTIATKDGKDHSVSRFTAVLANHEGRWMYATCQQQPEEEETSPHERLAPLAWMIGDWIDEGPEEVVAISCKWSEDGNFLLVNFETKKGRKEGIKSLQRIGWDPLAEQVRSWVFDTDGGYGDGRWTAAEGSWIIKSTAVMPDGQTGSATLVIQPDGKDKFIMKGLDRIVGDDTQPDFQMTIVRKPPQPSK
jgi:uncharacterized protein (TIGR02246 family)